MRLSQNWVTADIKKDIKSNQADLQTCIASGDKVRAAYYRGIIKGLELSLENIEKAFNKGLGKGAMCE